MSDPSRAYHAAVVQVSLNTAQEAMSLAFSSSLAADDYDHPRTVAIRKIQDAIQDVQKQGPIEWHRR